MTNEFEIEKKLFEQVVKPKNYLNIRVFNVFGDYYRVNAYTQTEENGLLKKRIGDNSYFCRITKDDFTIVSSAKIERARNPTKKSF